MSDLAHLLFVRELKILTAVGAVGTVTMQDVFHSASTCCNCKLRLKSCGEVDTVGQHSL